MGSTCMQDYEGVLWDDGWIISLASTRYTIDRRNDKKHCALPYWDGTDRTVRRKSETPHKLPKILGPSGA